MVRFRGGTGEAADIDDRERPGMKEDEGDTSVRPVMDDDDGKKGK